jgi:O-antigen/teichoic acid export membrane protein
MVSFFIGVEGVGLYTLAVNLAQLIWLISQSAATVLLPRIAASPESALENAARTAQITRLILWISLVLALALLLGAHLIVPLMYGKAFSRSIAPLLWLLPGIVAFSTVNVLASYLAGIGQPRINLFVALIGLSFTITLDFLLIPRFNITGAAIASSVSYSMSAVLTIWFFQQQSGRCLRDILLVTSEDISLAISLWRGIYQRLRLQKAG